MPYTFKFVNGTIGGKVLFEIDEEGLGSDAKSSPSSPAIDIDGDGEDKPPLTLGGASPASNTGPAESAMTESADGAPSSSSGNSQGLRRAGGPGWSRPGHPSGRDAGRHGGLGCGKSTFLRM